MGENINRKISSLCNIETLGFKRQNPKNPTETSIEPGVGEEDCFKRENERGIRTYRFISRFVILNVTEIDRK